MSKNFNFSGAVQIKHLNIRKQGNEDDRVTAVDVKVFSEKVSGPILDAILVPNERDPIKGVLWDAEGAPRMFGVNRLDSWIEFEKCVGTLLGQRFFIEKISKFTGALAADFGMDLTFSFSIVEPTNALLETLVAMMAEEVRLYIETPQIELPLSGVAA
jgi:hypothetical protein